VAEVPVAKFITLYYDVDDDLFG